MAEKISPPLFGPPETVSHDLRDEFRFGTTFVGRDPGRAPSSRAPSPAFGATSPARNEAQQNQPPKKAALQRSSTANLASAIGAVRDGTAEPAPSESKGTIQVEVPAVVMPAMAFRSPQAYHGVIEANPAFLEELALDDEDERSPKGSVKRGRRRVNGVGAEARAARLARPLRFFSMLNMYETWVTSLEDNARPPRRRRR